MFLKIDGIKGESMDSKHKDEVDLLSFSFGFGNSASAVGGGAGTGASHACAFNGNMRLNRATLGVVDATLTGKHIPQVVLTLVKPGEKAMTVLTATFSDVVFTQGGDQFAFVYGKFEADYNMQDAKGASTPGGTIGWDLKENTKL